MFSASALRRDFILCPCRTVLALVANLLSLSPGEEGNGAHLSADLNLEMWLLTLGLSSEPLISADVSQRLICLCT